MLPPPSCQLTALSSRISSTTASGGALALFSFLAPSIFANPWSDRPTPTPISNRLEKLPPPNTRYIYKAMTRPTGRHRQPRQKHRTRLLVSFTLHGNPPETDTDGAASSMLRVELKDPRRHHTQKKKNAQDKITVNSSKTLLTSHRQPLSFRYVY